MKEVQGLVPGTRSASSFVIVDANSAINRWDVGVFASTAAGSGSAISASRTAASRVYADDAGVALTGSTRAALSRMLVTTAIASGDVSVFGHQGHLKVNAHMHHTGNAAGLWGYAEMTASAVSTGHLAGVFAMCDCPTSGVIDTGGVLSGVLIGSNTLAGTHTGRAVGIHCANPVAGTFDAFLEIEASTGMVTASALSGGTSQYLKVVYNGTAYTILMTCA
jgi:hypothetical protein